MKCKFINVLVFTAGAAIGSAVTWKVIKTKYERIAQEEIDSVKEAYADMLSNLQEQVDDYSTADEADECTDRAAKAAALTTRTTHNDWSDYENLDDEEDDENEPDGDFSDYARLTNQYKNEKGGAEDMTKEPYVISPYDFGELDGYSQVELTYYADGTLEDEDYNIITDAEVNELIGRDSLYTFGEYEDDAVFVRNEHLRADFQILKDYRTYEEARSVGPNKVDDE